MDAKKLKHLLCIGIREAVAVLIFLLCLRVFRSFLPLTERVIRVCLETPSAFLDIALTKSMRGLSSVFCLGYTFAVQLSDRVQVFKMMRMSTIPTMSTCCGKSLNM